MGLRHPVCQLPEREPLVPVHSNLDIERVGNILFLKSRANRQSASR